MRTYFSLVMFDPKHGRIILWYRQFHFFPLAYSPLYVFFKIITKCSTICSTTRWYFWLDWSIRKKLFCFYDFQQGFVKFSFSSKVNVKVTSVNLHGVWRFGFEILAFFYFSSAILNHLEVFAVLEPLVWYLIQVFKVPGHYLISNIYVIHIFYKMKWPNRFFFVWMYDLSTS